MNKGRTVIFFAGIVFFRVDLLGRHTGCIGGVDRPKKFFLETKHGTKDPHKISERYDSPNPFKSCCDRVVKC